MNLSTAEVQREGKGDEMVMREVGGFPVRPLTAAAAVAMAEAESSEPPKAGA